MKQKMGFSMWSLFLGLSLSGAVEGAPRMDTGVGSSEPILATVVPDHEAPNLYYVFPQTSNIVMRANGRHDFLYIETRERGVWGPGRVLNAEARAWIQPSIESEPLARKIAEVKTANPAARYAVITPFKTEIVTSDASNQYIRGTDCTQVAGPLEVPVYCRLSINPRMTNGFKTLLRNSQVHVFHYLYHFYGFADGKIQEYRFSVPLRYGSLRGKGYFVDQWGRDLD
jgi:hypothetical protein